MSAPSRLSKRTPAPIAEEKIHAAQKAGGFDNLPGFGEPPAVIDEEDAPIDGSA